MYDIESDTKDHEMMNALRSSLEAASEYRTQFEALDFIGTRNPLSAQGINTTQARLQETNVFFFFFTCTSYYIVDYDEQISK